MKIRAFAVAILLLLTSVGSIFGADTLSYNLRNISNWAFYGTQNPVVDLVVVNPRQIERDLTLYCDIKSYKGESCYQFMQRGVVPSLDSVEMSFSFNSPVPGFYPVIFRDNDNVVKSVNIAYEPQRIDFKGRGEKDFAYFANLVSLERRDVSPQFTVMRNKNLSGREKTVYDFTMISRGDEAVKGYFATPKGKKLAPVMISFVEYAQRSQNPLADFTAAADMAELVLYVKDRGEGDDYFKNVLTDVALSIDFVLQRDEIDGTKVYTQGGGKGAIYSFLSSALNDNVAVSFVAAPNFKEFASTFTIESLTEKISAAILFGLGLQDSAFRLQESFAIYNKVSTYKEYFVFPASDGVIRNEWKFIRDSFLIRLNDFD